MRIISLNVGQLVTVKYQQKTITTGIYKTPVNHPLKLEKEQVSQDHIANPKVHGGYHKAVYVFPDEHYLLWQERYPHLNLEPGMFGENLTVEGLLEDEVYVGDLLHIADCILEVSEPRQPCFKLGIKFNDPGIIKTFLAAGTSGFYCRIIKAGTLPIEGPIELVPGPRRVSIAQLNSVLQGKPLTEEWWATAKEAQELSPKWQTRLLAKMEL